ncbi:hypothetical protein [Archangium violaceum]|uniref:OB-fold protein n=1 Tax=Archangium violaceum TaxID=83451 RepID=UPI0037BE6ADB
MALVKCKQCGGDVASNAAACPKCGAPPPRGSSVGKTVAFVFAGLFGLCFLGTCVSALSKGGGGGASSARASSNSPETARTVDIRTLLGEYRDNELRADSSFKGQLIQTSGIVGDVKKDFIGDAYVTLGSGEPLEAAQVQCILNKSQAKKAASLSQGARITVRGRVSGLMMNVIVRECDLISL